MLNYHRHKLYEKFKRNYGFYINFPEIYLSLHTKLDTLTQKIALKKDMLLSGIAIQLYNIYQHSYSFILIEAKFDYAPQRWIQSKSWTLYDHMYDCMTINRLLLLYYQNQTKIFLGRPYWHKT